MKKNISVMLMIFAFLFAVQAAAEVKIPDDALETASKTDQFILVRYTDASNADFRMYEKNDGGEWLEVISTSAYIGKNGMGKTREGDAKTPVGEFHFTMAFGRKDDPGCPIGYRKVDETDYWCGDSNSPLYNQFVSTRNYNNFNKDDSEHIIDYNPQYNYALNISYNEDGTPGKGSAIFLHCQGLKKYTGGCVSVTEEVMKNILKRVHKNCLILIKDK